MSKSIWTCIPVFVITMGISAACSLSCAQHSDVRLGSLSTLRDYRSMRVSSEDRPGNNDRLQIKAGETTTIANLSGPGEITHLWTTIATGDKNHLRNIVIRVYYDGNDFPSVESPIGDFYGLGHGKYYYFSNPVQAMGTLKGMNSFWPMPFRTSARIDITNEGSEFIGAFYYYVDWRKLAEWPQDSGYFHAQYRQEFPCKDGECYLFMETDGGPGQFMGVNLSIHTQVSGWWGEGDDRFTIDGETSPSLWGTGSEDYFAGAWGFGDTFYTDYLGMPLRTRTDHSANNHWNVYRLHLESPITFQKSLRAEIEHGWDGVSNTRQPYNNNFSSVAYWYMKMPTRLKGSLPPAGERMSRLIPRPGLYGYFDPQYMDYEAPKGTKAETEFYGAPKPEEPAWQDNSLFVVQSRQPHEFHLEFETTTPLKGKSYLRLARGPEFGTVSVRLDKHILAKDVRLDGSREPLMITGEAIELEPGRHDLLIIAHESEAEPRYSGWGLDYLRIGGEALPVETTR